MFSIIQTCCTIFTRFVSSEFTVGSVKFTEPAFNNSQLLFHNSPKLTANSYKYELNVFSCKKNLQCCAHLCMLVHMQNICKVSVFQSNWSVSARCNSWRVQMFADDTLVFRVLVRYYIFCAIWIYNLLTHNLAKPSLSPLSHICSYNK